MIGAAVTHESQLIVYTAGGRSRYLDVGRVEVDGVADRFANFLSID